MNTRPVIDTSPSPLSLSASFNSDSSCFAVGLEDGFCVFNSDPCEIKISRDLNAGIGSAEMLGRYNYLALVGGGRNPKWPQTKVIIWDDHKSKIAITLELKTAVLRVRLTKSRIVVALQNSVHIYKFSTQPERASSFETADNPLGLVCLGTKTVAFPGRSPGKVQLVELESGNVSIIPAHTSALRALDLSRDGAYLATASEQGTLIRVFSTANCTKIAELRRGVDPAFIFSIAISPNNSMLAVTSDKSTLHIFDLPTTTTSSANSPSSPKSPTAGLTSRNRSQSPRHHHFPGNHNNDDLLPTPAQKWGFLSRIPLLPRVFSDTYSFASTTFSLDNPSSSSSDPISSAQKSYLPALGSLPQRSQKGILGWLSEDTLLCIGTGRDGRWERFRVGERVGVGREEDVGVVGSGGVVERRGVWRDGWRRYLAGG